MQLLALVEAIAAGLSPDNVQLYIQLLDNIIAVAEKIEGAVQATPSTNKPTNS